MADWRSTYTRLRTRQRSLTQRCRVGGVKPGPCPENRSEAESSVESRESPASAHTPRRNRALERKKAAHQRDYQAWEAKHDAWEKRGQERENQKERLAEAQDYDITKEEDQHLLDTWNVANASFNPDDADARKHFEEAVAVSGRAHEEVFRQAYEKRLLPLLQSLGTEEKQLAAIQRKIETGGKKIHAAAQSWAKAASREMALSAERVKRYGPEPPRGPEHDAWLESIDDSLWEAIDAASEATSDAANAIDEVFTEQKNDIAEVVNRVLDRREAQIDKEEEADEEPIDEPDEPIWEREPEVERALESVDSHLEDAEADDLSASDDERFSEERQKVLDAVAEARSAVEAGDLEDDAEQLHQFSEVARQAATWLGTHGYSEGSKAMRRASAQARQVSQWLDSEEEPVQKSQTGRSRRDWRAVHAGIMQRLTQKSGVSGAEGETLLGHLSLREKSQTVRCQEGANQGKPGPCPEGKGSPASKPATPASTSTLPRQQSGVLNRLGKTGRAVRKMKVAEHRLLGMVKAHVPGKLQAAASLAIKGVFSSWIPAQAAAYAIAKEVGGERHAKRVARMLIGADLIGAKVGPLVAGALGGPAAATTVYMTPLASSLYVMYSLARHPKAVLAAARKAIQKVRQAGAALGTKVGLSHKAGWQEGAGEARWSREAIAELLRLMDTASDPDWCEALVWAALMETGGDLEEAVRLVQDAEQGDMPSTSQKSMTVSDLHILLTERAGFTGEKKDKRGYRMCYEEGKRTKCAPKNAADKANDRRDQRPEEKEKLAGGEAGAKPETAEKPAQPEKKPRAPRQPKVPPPSVDDMADALAKSRDRGLTPEMLTDAAELLGRMTVKDIQAVKAKLGIKASGVKAQLVQKIMAAVGAKVPTQPEPRERMELNEEPQEEAKPAPKPQWKPPSTPQEALSAAVGRIKANKEDSFDQAMTEAKSMLSSPEGREVLAASGLHPQAGNLELASYLSDVASGIESQRARRQLNEDVEARTGVVAVRPPSVRGEKADKKFADAVSSGLSDKRLSEDQRKTYKSALDRATASMPRVSLDRMASNVEGMRFSTSGHAMPADIVSEMERLASSGHADITPDVLAGVKEQMEWIADSGAPLGGCYMPSSKTVHLDGGRTGEHGREARAANRAVDAHEIYTHELGHAIDGPDFEYSNSMTWKKIFAEEITSGNALNDYASSATFEAFAEFSRLVYGEKAKLSEVESQFPKASKFFKDNQLWPETKK